MRRLCCRCLLLVALAGCGEDDNRTGAIEPVIRGLKTCLVEDVEETTVRHYPSVLQPSSTTTLILRGHRPAHAGQISMSARASSAGDVIAEIDPTSLQNCRSTMPKARSSRPNQPPANAEEDFSRKSQLVEQGCHHARRMRTSRRTNMETSQAQVVQAAKQLETAEENLGKSVLTAPFDGIVSSVDVESFTNVTAGSPVATIYADDRFESSFTVSFDIVNQLAVGKRAVIRLADDPTRSSCRAMSASSDRVRTACRPFRWSSRLMKPTRC